jgi:hypothetical protein
VKHLSLFSQFHSPKEFGIDLKYIYMEREREREREQTNEIAMTRNKQNKTS